MPRFVIVDDSLVVHGDYCAVVCDRADSAKLQAVIYRFLEPESLDWNAEEIEDQLVMFLLTKQQELGVRSDVIADILKRLRDYFKARQKVENGLAS